MLVSKRLAHEVILEMLERDLKKVRECEKYRNHTTSGQFSYGAASLLKLLGQIEIPKKEVNKVLSKLQKLRTIVSIAWWRFDFDEAQERIKK